jgi:hypothetical protein
MTRKLEIDADPLVVIVSKAEVDQLDTSAALSVL